MTEEYTHPDHDEVYDFLLTGELMPFGKEFDDNGFTYQEVMAANGAATAFRMVNAPAGWAVQILPDGFDWYEYTLLRIIKLGDMSYLDFRCRTREDAFELAATKVKDVVLSEQMGLLESLDFIPFGYHTYT